MLVRTGHRPEDWRDEGPSQARLSGVRGGLVEAALGWRDAYAARVRSGEDAAARRAQRAKAKVPA